MAKITGYAPPPELAAAADKLITTTNAPPGQLERAGSRRGSRVSPAAKPSWTPQNDFTAAAAYIATLEFPDGPPHTRAKRARAIVNELKDGIFDPRYWTEAELLSTTYQQAAPTSTQDANPPPYAYRTPENMPTIPTYGAGSPAAAPARYDGATQDGLFRDSLLVWAIYHFRLQAPTAPAAVRFAYALIDSEMTVNASDRGSKPMLSLITSGALCAETDAAMEGMDPITDGIPVNAPSQSRHAQSHYWRYQLPMSSPPYFQQQPIRQIVRDLDRSATISDAAPITRAIIKASPRPMFGRGFNNNTAVTISAAVSVRIMALFQVFNAQFRTEGFEVVLQPRTPYRTRWNDYTLHGWEEGDVNQQALEALPKYQKGAIFAAGVEVVYIDILYTIDPAGGETHRAGHCPAINATYPSARFYLHKKEGATPAHCDYTLWHFDFSPTAPDDDIEITETRYKHDITGRRTIESKQITVKQSALYPWTANQQIARLVLADAYNN